MNAATLVAMARTVERYNPDQPRAPRGTTIGGRFISADAVLGLLRSAGQDTVAAQVERLATRRSSGASSAGGRLMSAQSLERGRAAHLVNVAKADKLRASIRRDEERLSARKSAGDPLLNPGAAKDFHATLRRKRDELADLDADIAGYKAMLTDHDRTFGGKPAGGAAEKLARAKVAELAKGADSPEPAPKKTAAAKVAAAKRAAKETEPPADVVAKLRAATSREEGATALKGKTRAELVEIAKTAGVHHTARATKSQLEASIVQWLVGRRLTTDAITGTSNREPVAGSVSSQDVKSRITAAYSDLAEQNGDLVGLVRLRHRLADIDRATLDQTLKAMDRARLIHLDPDPNRKALPPEAHEAAIRIGGEDKHFITAGHR